MIELREVVRSDAACIYESWGRFEENFERLTAKPFRQLSDAHRYLEELLSNASSSAFHLVSAGEVIGLVKAVVVQHRAQVGYVVHRPHWGRGLATLAVRELVSRLNARPEIQRVWATCALDNPGSARVLDKCGFEREGVLRNWAIYPALGGRAVDNYSYVHVTPLSKV
jgi:RimJ/RimL family protein N-acetyltransferase